MATRCRSSPCRSPDQGHGAGSRFDPLGCHDLKIAYSCIGLGKVCREGKLSKIGSRRRDPVPGEYIEEQSARGCPVAVSFPELLRPTSRTGGASPTRFRRLSYSLAQERPAKPRLPNPAFGLAPEGSPSCRNSKFGTDRVPIARFGDDKVRTDSVWHPVLTSVCCSSIFSAGEVAIRSSGARQRRTAASTSAATAAGRATAAPELRHLPGDHGHRTPRAASKAGTAGPGIWVIAGTLCGGRVRRFLCAEADSCGGAVLSAPVKKQEERPPSASPPRGSAWKKMMERMKKSSPA